MLELIAFEETLGGLTKKSLARGSIRVKVGIKS
jgi:hypothetical protein